MTHPTPAKSVRRRRGEYAKSAITRVAILDAALEVFAQSGYRAGSLRDVAARVEMSEAGLLHHFPSKAKLLAAVLDRRDDRSRQLVPLDDGDPASIIRGLVRLAASNAATPGVVELYCTLSAEATSADHPAHTYFVERYEYVRATVEQAFTALQADGRLRNGVSPRRATVTTIALMDGLQVQWLLDRGALDMARELRNLLEDYVDIDWSDPHEGAVIES